MSKPLISVVMPVYNGEEYLQQAVDSILTQTLNDFELIIVNDGSTDRTANLLDYYCNSDDRVKIYNQPNQGMVKATNAGVSYAKGRYVARMDSDDIAPSDRFERQVEFLLANSEVAVLGGEAKTILSDGTLLEKTLSPPLTDPEIRARMVTHNCMAHGTIMMLRQAFLEVGGYREEFSCAEDYDLWLRMSEKYALANLPVTLMYYRLHYNQTSIRRIEQQSMEALAAQCASQARLATGVDPIPPKKQITRALLNQLGVTDTTIDDTIISRYKEIITFISRVSLPTKDREHLDSFFSEALGFIRSAGGNEAWVHELRSRI